MPGLRASGRIVAALWSLLGGWWSHGWLAYVFGGVRLGWVFDRVLRDDRLGKNPQAESRVEEKTPSTRAPPTAHRRMVGENFHAWVAPK